MGNRHKKRFLRIPFLKEIQRKVGNAVRPVTLKIYSVIIFIKHISVIAMRGKFQHVRRPPESRISPSQLPGNGCDRVINRRRLLQFSIAGKVPLPDISRFITGLLNIIRQRLNSRGQHNIIAEASCFRRILSRLEKRAARPANWLRGKGIFKFYPLLCQTVQIGSDIQRLPIASASIRPLLIRKIKYNIISHKPISFHYFFPSAFASFILLLINVDTARTISTTKMIQ